MVWENVHSLMLSRKAQDKTIYLILIIYKYVVCACMYAYVCIYLEYNLKWMIENTPICL